MRRSTTYFTATVLTLGLTAAGFAGVAAAGEQLTQKEFLKQGNAICKTANKDISAVVDPIFAGLGRNEQPSPEQIAAIVAGAVPIYRGALSEIEALAGPASLEKKVAKALDQYTAALDAVEADPQAAFSRAGPDPFAKPNKTARKLGLKQCTQ
jgi:hypothetical protein